MDEQSLETPEKVGTASGLIVKPTIPRPVPAGVQRPGDEARFIGTYQLTSTAGFATQTWVGPVTFNRPTLWRPRTAHPAFAWGMVFYSPRVPAPSQSFSEAAGPAGVLYLWDPGNWYVLPYFDSAGRWIEYDIFDASDPQFVRQNLANDELGTRQLRQFGDADITLAPAVGAVICSPAFVIDARRIEVQNVGANPARIWFLGPPDGTIPASATVGKLLAPGETWSLRRSDLVLAYLYGFSTLGTDIACLVWQG